MKKNLNHIISKITLTEGPTYVWWRIDYMYVLDWVRSRQSESVKLGNYPLPSEPTDEEIRNAVNLAIENAEQFNLKSVVSLTEVEAAFNNCVPDMSIDWCHIDFENVSGRLKVKGSKVINWQANQCQKATVDVSNGELFYCYMSVCRYY